MRKIVNYLITNYLQGVCNGSIIKWGVRKGASGGNPGRGAPFLLDASKHSTPPRGGPAAGHPVRLPIVPAHPSTGGAVLVFPMPLAPFVEGFISGIDPSLLRGFLRLDGLLNGAGGVGLA